MQFDPKILISAAALLGMGLAVGLAIGIGIFSGKFIESIARQPESIGQTRVWFFLAYAFCETQTIFAMLFALILLGKVG
jgi:F-type H+-transporting ATPase subunit c